MEFFFSKLKFGMAMGNPLSPVLIVIYTWNFTKNIFYLMLYHRVFFWRRYVDDIFCLWPRVRNSDEFVLATNNLVPSVTFTFERERTMNSVFRF